MSLPSPRLQQLDLVTTCPEPNNSAARLHTVPAFTPSSMTTTTFTASTVDSTCVGLWVVPEDGDARGQPRQVKSFSSTTATVDAAWVSVSGVTRIRAWVPADGPVRVTTADSSGQIDVISTVHAGITNEPDGTFVNDGYALIGVSGANAGKARRPSNFTSSTGTFSDGAASSTAIGDLFLLRKLLRPEGDVDASVTQRTQARTIVGSGHIDANVPVPINHEGTIKFELPVRPIGTAGASAVVTGRPTEINDILEDLFTRTSDTGGTVASATSSTVDCTSSAFTAGGFALLATGEAVQIMSISAEDIASYGTGQLTNGSVAASSVIHASTWYKRKTSDWRTRTFDLWRGGLLRQCFQGCMPKVSISITRDQIVRFTFDYMASEAIEYTVTRPVAVGAASPLTFPDTGIPVDGKGARCLIDGIKVNLTSLSIDFGFTPKMRQSLSGLNQYDGCFMDPGPVTGSMTLLADSDDRTGGRTLADQLRYGRYAQFLYQKGTNPKETFCIGIPAMHVSQTNFKYTDRQGEIQADFQAVLPEAAGYAAASFPGLPAISIGYL